MRATRAWVKAIVVGIVACGPPVAAQAPDSTTHLKNALRLGDAIWVVDRSGEEFRGRLVDVSDSRLAIQSREGRRDIAFDQVVRVRRSQADPLWSGVIAGSAVGIGGPLFYCAKARESGETCGENVGDLLITGAIGAGIGTLLDMLVKQRKVVYERPKGAAQRRLVPLIGTRTLGVQMTITTHRRR